MSKLSDILGQVMALSDSDKQTVVDEMSKAGFVPRKKSFSFGSESFDPEEMGLAFGEMFHTECGNSKSGFFLKVSDIAEADWSVSVLTEEDGSPFLRVFDSEDDNLDSVVLSFHGKWDSRAVIRQFVSLVRNMAENL